MTRCLTCGTEQDHAFCSDACRTCGDCDCPLQPEDDLFCAVCTVGASCVPCAVRGKKAGP